MDRMLYQKKIWTMTGVPRKNQVNRNAHPERMGFALSRRTAVIYPPMMPIDIATKVNHSVSSAPLTYGEVKMSAPTWSQPNRHCVPRPVCEGMCEMSVWIIIATTTRITPAATQRPGWRTGTILGGRAPLADPVGPTALNLRSAAGRVPCGGASREGC